MVGNNMNIWYRAAFTLLCVILVFVTVAYGGVHQPIIAIYYLLVTIVGITWVIGSIHNRSFVYNAELLQLPLIGAAVYAFIQIIPIGTISDAAGVRGIPAMISMDPYATLISAFQFTSVFVFFAVLLVCLDSAQRIRRLFIFLSIFGFIYAFFAILQSIQSPARIYGIYEVALGSPFGSFVNRNNFAAFVVMTLALPLGLLMTRAVSKDKRLLYFTGILLMGIALLLSGSRGGLVAFASEIILILILTRQGMKGKHLVMRFMLIALLVIAIIGGSVFVGGDTSLDRFAETATSEDFTTDRTNIWRVTTGVIAENLPFGAGFGAFGVAYTRFDARSGLLRVEQAHNDYLQVIADAGIPGFLLGALFLVLLFRLGIRSMKIENTFRRGIAIGAFAGCFAVLVHSIFDFVLHVTAVSLLFVILLALLSAGQNDFKDDLEDESRIRRRKRKPERSGQNHLPAKTNSYI